MSPLATRRVEKISASILAGDDVSKTSRTSKNGGEVDRGVAFEQTF